MNYCSNCGHEIIFESDFCPNCGKPLKENNVEYKEVKDNSKTYGIWAIVLGFIPLVGWIVGGIGLKRANLYNNKTGRTLNLIGIVISTISFFFNLANVLT